ncbi:glycosyltransferase family 2 protein [Salinicoccus sesuvii]|uniref:Glycosyltransferase family 2 protein n=1 Tax=Salinicoccus sesuvii TaxID=868281 RepID=A0ABV7N788_9STAP
MLKKILSKPVDWAVYSLLDEKQRKQIGDLLSQKQKDTVVRLLNGKKFTQRRKLKVLKQHLYNFGFTDRALSDMDRFLHEADNMEIKRLISWELSLWHANKNTTEGAKVALEYLPTATTGETSVDQQRRISIVTAECLSRVGELSEAKVVLQQQLKKQVHPDLYLAEANLENDIQKRFEFINKAFSLYNLAPIGFSKKSDRQTYDDLATLSNLDSVTDGPKVSIILPAFKAEEGIKIAIDSILGQTWRNLELIVVDDCSPDGTADVVKSYAKKDERVKFMSTPTNSGPYVARNIGLNAVTGEFVTINDADDWSHAKKIETQVTHLLDHPKVVANTSEHARLTEDLTFYRRGTPGKYIFPNMSSIMFRREPVLDTLGYWDSVRFAADGEFKRRLIKAFGQSSYTDLKSGPLSLPRQSVSSLTSSSAFGYDGFFMGVRKEYVESLEFHHKTSTLYYEYPQSARPFPVPEPMWPIREEKVDGSRQFDYVVVADFRRNSDMLTKQIMKLKTQYTRIGLMQLYSYDLQDGTAIDPSIRQVIDGTHVQMLVYGEKISTIKLNVTDPELLMTWQKYRPTISAEEVIVTVDKRIESEALSLIQTHMVEYFNAQGRWITKDSGIESYLDRLGIVAETKGVGGSSDV